MPLKRREEEIRTPDPQIRSLINRVISAFLNVPQHGILEIF